MLAFGQPFDLVILDKIPYNVITNNHYLGDHHANHTHQADHGG